MSERIECINNKGRVSVGCQKNQEGNIFEGQHTPDSGFWHSGMCDNM